MAEFLRDVNNNVIPVLQYFGGRIIAATVATARDTLPTGASIVTLSCDALAYVKFGTGAVNASIADDGFDTVIQAGSRVDCRVPSGATHVAVILPAGTATLAIMGVQ